MHLNWEFRRVSLGSRLEAGDQETVMAIQRVDEPTFRARWNRHLEEEWKAKYKRKAAERGPSAETRKTLREKRKKKKK